MTDAHVPKRVDDALSCENPVRRHQLFEPLRESFGDHKDTMDRLRLKTAFVTRGHTQALKDGTVRPRAFDFDFEEVPVNINAYRRMVRGLEFDISEMAITTYICARAHGKAFTALPIFLVRAFHHGAIVYNTKGGITGPKDLEGKKVGVNRGYTVTTGLWARSILQHQYGVDLGQITWVLSGDEHVAEYQPPPNVVPIEKGKTLEDLLLSGEIAAAIGVQTDSPDVKPLIPNAREAGFDALRERGLYPINHTLVVRDDVLSANPDLAPDIFNAFAEAKRLYVQRLAADEIEQSSDDAVYRRVMEITGADPLPYGIAPNRRMLEAVIRHSVEQGIISHPVAVEELFPRNTYGLTG
jgi:ABC-type nitrate/sulfonate/bicarbonate transport system substrate-binding protein